MKILENFPLKDITTMHLDVRCKYFAEYSTVEDLLELLDTHQY